MSARRDLVTPVRWIVGVLTVVTVALTTAGFWHALRDPRTLGTDEVSDLMASIGVPVELTIVVGLVLPMVVAAFVAGLILVRRPDSVLVLVFALSVVTMSATVSRSLFALSSAAPGLRPLVDVVYISAIVTFAYFLLVFPGDRFKGPATRVFWVATIVFALSRPSAIADVTVRRLDAATSATDLFYMAGYAVIFTVVFTVQFFRYRGTTGQKRLQMRWVMLPVSVLGCYVTFTLVVPSLFIELPPRYFAVAMVGAIPLGIAFPLCLARGVLKYRLYEIDVVINRAAVYITLTAILAGAYVGLVFVFQSLLAPITAESDIAIAASTLAVAALFGPLRRRVQTFIDKRFYRRRFDAQQTLEQFGSSLRDEVELVALSRSLTGVVSETMQPQHVSLWLRTGTS